MGLGDLKGAGADAKWRVRWHIAHMMTPAAPRLEHVLDQMMDAVCVVDGEDRFVYVNAACEHIFGYSPEELIGRVIFDLIHPDDLARTRAAATAVLAGRPINHFENRYLRKDGRIVHIMWTARWSEADGYRIGVARDITEHKRAEAIQGALLAISEAAHTAADLLSMFRRIHEIIHGLLPAQNFFVALLEPEGKTISFPYFVDAHDDPPGPMPLEAGTLTGEVIRSGKPLLLTPDSEPVTVDDTCPVGTMPTHWLGVPLSIRHRVIGALVVQSYTGDISYSERDQQLLQFVSTQIAAAIERKQSETWLRHVAQHDALTGLPNRSLFEQRLASALSSARDAGEYLAVLYLDMDAFKAVNDTCGHDTGDALLKDVARRMRGCVRESDTACRMGGDEFVLLLAGIKQTDHALLVGEKIRVALNRPFEVAGRTLQVSASIGIAVFPEHGVEAQQLIREADRAMYDAKHSGGNRCVASIAHVSH